MLMSLILFHACASFSWEIGRGRSHSLNVIGKVRKSCSVAPVFLVPMTCPPYQFIVDDYEKL